MRMKKRDVATRSLEEKKSSLSMELCSLHVRAGELYERAAALWLKVDGQVAAANACFSAAAAEYENAGVLVMGAIQNRNVKMHSLMGDKTVDDDNENVG